MRSSVLILPKHHTISQSSLSVVSLINKRRSVLLTSNENAALLNCCLILQFPKIEFVKVKFALRHTWKKKSDVNQL